ncbi:HEAT repeat domain-containing protein [Bythopirellula polymerisocia]|uniref:HEAT repeat protein n=1 Tax=Bythopirellula polymerisocia TaxID=2528003 RepID=A0A5C6CRZ4_9BACT|nr:HEAT repeat domain-containing protein [Bythopirellula polymerisocia]TWU27320.1 HEAT repeat protein [Bythopirellula polymerisocia]
MKTPIELTFDVLANSRNESANEVLLAGFEQKSGPLYLGALKTILARRSKETHSAVIKRWHDFDEEEREFVIEARGRISGALRDALLTDDSVLFGNACQIIELMAEYDLVPNLLTLAEHTSSPHAADAAALVQRLTANLSDLLQSPAIGNNNGDPQVFRKSVLDGLKRSLDRFRYHKRTEILDAFCLICGPDDYLLLTILDDPHHPCFKGICQVLASSDYPTIHNLLADLLQSEKAPATILSIISHRTDREFICQLLGLFDQERTAAFSRNLKRLRSFSWLNAPTHRLSGFEEQDQLRAVQLLSASGVSSDTKLDAIEELVINGEPAGRATACDALAEFSGDHANHLILQAVYDTAPQVQAAATRQLRDRHIPGTMPLLSDLLDSKHEEVRCSAREALAEFSFENFVKTYDGLSEEARQTTGNLVQRVDEEYLPMLKEEFTSPGVKRRLRAIEIALLLEVVPFVVDNLIALLTDNDHIVRTAAAEALRYWPVPEVQAALESAAHDRSAAVQNAARSSLTVFASYEPTNSTGFAEVQQ